MKDIADLSDAELRAELADRGEPCGPIVGTTRKVYELKLAKLRSSGATSYSQPTPAQAGGDSDGGGTASQQPRKRGRPPKNAQPVRKSPSPANHAGSDTEELDQSQVIRRGTAVRQSPKKSPSPTRRASPGRRRFSTDKPANAIIPGLNTSLNDGTPKDTPSPRASLGARVFTASGSRTTIQSPAPTSTKTTSKTFTTITSPAPTARKGSPARRSSAWNSRFSDLTTGRDEDDEHDNTTSESKVFSVHRSAYTSPRSNFANSNSAKTSTTAGGNLSWLNSLRQRLPGGGSQAELKVSREPGSLYELRMAGHRTRVTRDPKTGRVEIRDEDDVPRYGWFSTIVILLALLALLFGTAYTVRRDENARRLGEALVGGARQTATFFYNYAIWPILLVIVVAALGAVGYFGLAWWRQRTAQEEKAFRKLVDEIIDHIRLAGERGTFVSVPHLRDQILPPHTRTSSELARWDRAAQFIDAHESRVATDVRVVQGHEQSAWRWIPSDASTYYATRSSASTSRF